MVCVLGGPSARAGYIDASWNTAFTTYHDVYPLTSPAEEPAGQQGDKRPQGQRQGTPYPLCTTFY